MKKVLVAGAALMLAAGLYSSASAAEVKPGVVITGDFRARYGYTSEEYWGQGRFGNRDGYDGVTLFDHRARVNIAGTAAGGTYVKVRLRFEGATGDIDADPTAINDDNSNLWADMAYIGIPFSDTVTVELGRYRSTYGPLAATNNFFYDDVSLAGAKGIIKIGDVEINPFVEYMEEAQNKYETGYLAADENQRSDNDEIRFGVHAKGKVNKDWTVGGMLGYQMDSREEVGVGLDSWNDFTPNEGFFGSLYVSGKSGAFGLAAELAVTDNDLNNFNSWEIDQATYVGTATAPISATNTNDRIGSDDTGFGGYVFPNFQIDKLNIGLNLGFTAGGFQPDRAFGFVMVGTSDNSRISAVRIGDTGDWMWGGLVASYAINDSLKLTGNLVYASVDAWDTKGPAGDGPNTTSGAIGAALDDAWELSAILQYTITKGTDLYLSAGYLKPSFDNSSLEDDAAIGMLSRIEVKF